MLSQYLKRTEWVLSGLSKDQILERILSALASKAFTAPDSGAMSYMMSAHGYLSDDAGHWLPHLMFYLPRTESSLWGENLAGSPVLAHQGALEPVTVFFVPVREWSDGSPAGSHHSI